MPAENFIKDRFEPWIALRYLQSRRKEVFISVITVISILGVAVSVMVLNIVLAVMTGFEGELKSKLIDTSSHIVVRQYGGEMARWKDVQREVLSLPEVLSAEPYSYNQGMLSHEGSAHGLLVEGITNSQAQVEKLQKNIVSGSIAGLFTTGSLDFVRPDGTNDTVLLPTVVVGKALANRYGLRVGVPITILAPQFSAAPQGLLPKLRRFLIVGIYSSGLVEYESGLAFTSLPVAQSFFGKGENVTGLEVMVKDLEQTKAVGNKIVAKLEALGGAFETSDWAARNKPLYDALNLEKRVYFIVLLLLILIASFSIVSTLVMVVMEKSRDIAMLKTLGASNGSIRNIFLFQGSVIGAAGTVLGTVLGLLGCFSLDQYGWELDESVFALTKVPVYLVPVNFVVVGTASFVITTLAGIYPAMRAAKLRVADALRFE
jgi:lipoprotein-releasing system permease protein